MYMEACDLAGPPWYLRGPLTIWAALLEGQETKQNQIYSLGHWKKCQLLKARPWKEATKEPGTVGAQ